MHVIAMTNDPVRLSFLIALLRDAGFDPVVLDGFMGATEGSIGAIPRRVVVAEADAPAALRLLQQAGEA